MQQLLRSLDIWRSAIVRTPADQLRQSDLTAEQLVWLPQPENRFAFRADPFGVWHDGNLHVFVERFDYRILKGEVELLVFDARLTLLESRVVLAMPWHLSYPFVFRDQDDYWMLPEASRSGELKMYRATAFPFNWEEAMLLDVPPGALDPTPFRYKGRWWLLYALADPAGSRQCALHIVFADRLAGPWIAHPLNPVRVGLKGTRPGGTPMLRDDGLIDVPVQDGSRTYGGAVRRLTISRLDEEHFVAEDSPWLAPSHALSPFDQGVHTIAAAGDVSLIDCKRIDRSISTTLAWRRGKLARRKRQGAAGGK